MDKRRSLFKKSNEPVQERCLICNSVLIFNPEDGFYYCSRCKYGVSGSNKPSNSTKVEPETTLQREKSSLFRKDSQEHVSQHNLGVNLVKKSDDEYVELPTLGTEEAPGLHSITVALRGAVQHLEFGSLKDRWFFFKITNFTSRLEQYRSPYDKLGWDKKYVKKKDFDKLMEYIKITLKLNIPPSERKTLEKGLVPQFRSKELFKKPDTIVKNYDREKETKYDALNKMLTLIENSEDDSVTIDSVDSLLKLNLEPKFDNLNELDERIFDDLENLLISHDSERVKCAAIRSLFYLFPKHSLEPLSFLIVKYEPKSSSSLSDVIEIFGRFIDIIKQPLSNPNSPYYNYAKELLKALLPRINAFPKDSHYKNCVENIVSHDLQSKPSVIKKEDLDPYFVSKIFNINVAPIEIPEKNTKRKLSLDSEVFIFPKIHFTADDLIEPVKNHTDSKASSCIINNDLNLSGKINDLNLQSRPFITPKLVILPEELKRPDDQIFLFPIKKIKAEEEIKKISLSKLENRELIEKISILNPPLIYYICYHGSYTTNLSFKYQYIDLLDFVEKLLDFSIDNIKFITKDKQPKHIHPTLTIKTINYYLTDIGGEIYDNLIAITGDLKVLTHEPLDQSKLNIYRQNNVKSLNFVQIIANLNSDCYKSHEALILAFWQLFTFEEPVDYNCANMLHQMKNNYTIVNFPANNFSDNLQNHFVELYYFIDNSYKLALGTKLFCNSKKSFSRRSFNVEEEICKEYVKGTAINKILSCDYCEANFYLRLSFDKITTVNDPINSLEHEFKRFKDKAHIPLPKRESKIKNIDGLYDDIVFDYKNLNDRFFPFFSFKCPKCNLDDKYEIIKTVLDEFKDYKQEASFKCNTKTCKVVFNISLNLATYYLPILEEPKRIEIEIRPERLIPQEQEVNRAPFVPEVDAFQILKCYLSEKNSILKKATYALEDIVTLFPDIDDSINNFLTILKALPKSKTRQNRVKDYRIKIQASINFLIKKGLIETVVVDEKNQYKLTKEGIKHLKTMRLNKYNSL